MTDFLQSLSDRRCGSKKTYTSEAKAVAAARRRSIATGEWIQSYKCIDCTGWHIGHATPDQVAAANSEAQKKQIHRCNYCGTPCNGTYCGRECKKAARPNTR